jgi:hypothetical protein
MHSKCKARQTVAERAYVERVAALDCVVCGAAAPSEVHEVKQGAWFLSCALCPDCHRNGFLGLHGQKRAWTVRKLDELDALGLTVAGVMRSLSHH